MQEASVMAVRGDDETPLIYSTQTAATVADLEMEDKNKEPNTYRLTGEGTGTGFGLYPSQGLVLLHLCLEVRVSQTEQVFYRER